MDGLGIVTAEEVINEEREKPLHNKLAPINRITRSTKRTTG